MRLALEKSGDNAENTSLVLETELVRYRWRGVDGKFPDYERLVPASFNTVVSFDANEAIRAVGSLKILSESSKFFPIDLSIADGKMVVSSPDEKGQTEIAVDAQGEGKIRVSSSYLADALRACGGMVELKLVNPQSAMVFAVDGFELVTMPIQSGASPKPTETKPSEPAKAETTQPAEVKPAEPVKAETTETPADKTGDKEAKKAQAVAEAEAIAKGKLRARHAGKHAKAREPVAVA